MRHPAVSRARCNSFLEFPQVAPWTCGIKQESRLTRLWLPSGAVSSLRAADPQKSKVKSIARRWMIAGGSIEIAEHVFDRFEQRRRRSGTVE